MDSGRLPCYRSSYLLRFHPYPRVKPSVQERLRTILEDDYEDAIVCHDRLPLPYPGAGHMHSSEGVAKTLDGAFRLDITQIHF